MPNFVTIYSDDREPNWRRIYPAVCGGRQGDAITFVNCMNDGIELHFKNWPFEETKEDPATLDPKSDRSFTLAKGLESYTAFPFTAKVARTYDEAEGSRPILIIYP